ncbi:MAG: helix-turn-helix transcriptional regulator [Cytophagales bacterium]|nr:helix-turn-helix transcriptional regulator [Armatimonadota bacterium]
MQLMSQPFNLALALDHPFAVAAYPPGATFGPRFLRTWEFVWMLEGDAVYTREGLPWVAPQGSLVLCSPGVTDFFRWDPHHRTRHAYFHFDLQGDPPLSWPSLSKWPIVRLPETTTDLLRPLFRHLLTWSGKGDAAQRQLIALSLLAAFVTGETETDNGSAPLSHHPLPDPVERGLAFIAARLDQRPQETVPLAAIADAAFVTPEHLCRLFKAATGHSPSETVRLARLDRAVTLLCRSNFSISQVAQLCGFASPFHFSRRFKEAFGQSPRALRAAVASGEFPAPTTARRHSDP